MAGGLHCRAAQPRAFAHAHQRWPRRPPPPLRSAGEYFAAAGGNEAKAKEYAGLLVAYSSTIYKKEIGVAQKIGEAARLAKRQPARRLGGWGVPRHDVGWTRGWGFWRRL